MISQHEGFTESEPEDLPRYLERLRRLDAYEARLCDLRTPSQPGTQGWAQIGFGWAQPEDLDIRDGEITWSHYSADEVAIIGEHGAHLYARCPSDRQEPFPGPYLHGMLITPYQEHCEDARMAALNSVTRAVADGLGCLDASGLSTDNPQPLDE